MKERQVKPRPTATGKRLGDVPRVLIIGVGNPARGDDGVGIAVARALAAKRFANATVVEASGEGTTLTQLWQGAQTVILVDAVAVGAEPGTIHRIDARTQALPTDVFRGSSHSFGVAEAIELARALNQLPPRLVIYGIEGKSFESGIGLSPEVIGGARRVVGRIARGVREQRRRSLRPQPPPPILVAAR
jgi:hydrogenase maturation protease